MISAQLIAVVILLIIVVIYYQINPLYDHLPGVYTGDPEFLAESGLKEFVFLIHKVKGKYSCKIIVEKADGSNVENGDFSAKISLHPFTTKPYFTLHLSDETIFPRSVDMTLNILHGSLTLHDKNTVYAYLLKDHDFTNELLN